MSDGPSDSNRANTVDVQHAEYDVALSIFRDAVIALSRGDLAAANQLLRTLDLSAIERDREQLRAIARRARHSMPAEASPQRRTSIPAAVKEGVRQRDRYHCRFTGRRLIDTGVFQEVTRLSDVFTFDAHHAVWPTRRGPGGHPMVRTHGAAFDHFSPLSHGGLTSIDNVLQTSVHLNEAKGAKLLDLVQVPEDDWAGLTEYLSALRNQTSLPTKKAEATEQLAPRASVSKANIATMPLGENLRQAATASGVLMYSLGDATHGEDAFLQLRQANPNWFFATERSATVWSTHRLYCSSLAFNVPRKLTASPKVCASELSRINEWAERCGLSMTACRRCRNTK